MTDARNARFFLREATGALHAELDASFADIAFDDRHSYADFLRRQAAPLFALERALEHHATAIGLTDWTARRRTEALQRDLTVLEAPSPDATDSSKVDLPSPDAALGALYVLEGSRLGAKFLVKRARGSGDPTVREATAYLAHGETMSFWPTFLTLLADREAAGLDRAALVAGADQAFRLFLDEAKRERPEAA